MRSLSSERISVSAVLREKCSRNKRKFRQDLPLNSQGKSIQNHTGCKSSWAPECRSTEVVTSKSSDADSPSRKGNDGDDGGSNSPTSKSYHQDQVKLLRLRSEQQRILQAAGSRGGEGKREEFADEHSRKFKDDLYELEEADWDDCAENELEDLLVKSLCSLYDEAINKIVALGHSAEEALSAVLKRGRCYGGQDAVSNVVENSLAYLTEDKLHSTDVGDPVFSDLKELHKYSLAEMVGLLREVRPLLSKGDAMWHLLMCDMNVSVACVMDDSALAPNNKEPFPGILTNHHEEPIVGSSSSPPLPLIGDSALSVSSTHSSSSAGSMHPLSDAVVGVSPRSVPIPASFVTESSSPPSSVSTPDVSLPASESNPLSGPRDFVDEASSNFEEPTTEVGLPKLVHRPTLDDCTTSEGDDIDDEDDEDDEDEEEAEGVTCCSVVPALASLKLAERADQENVCTAECVHSENTCPATLCDPARVLPQPSQHMDAEAESEEDEDLEISERNQRASEALPGEEGDSCQLHSADSTALGNCDTHGACQEDLLCVRPELTGADAESPEALSSVGTVESVVDRTIVPLSESGSPSSVDGTVTTRDTLQGLALVSQKTDADCLSKEASVAKAVECLGEGTSELGIGQAVDQKDEIIMKLVHRSKELEIQLKERTEWAKQKVMQAARRLSNDLQELKSLRLEREEALRLKRDKQALEDSTMKKITDLENCLRKAKNQLDEASKAAKKLESDYAEVRAEMQAAKLSAAESQSSCEDMAKRERKSTKRAQAWEKQKAKLQEDLSDEKRKTVGLQQQILIAKERQQQAEVRWRQEEKAKEEAVLRADHERRASEQAASAAKKREEAMRKKAESTYQRHRDDIQRLESEIAQFRTSAEAAQLATSRWGPGVAVSPHMLGLCSLQALKESNNRLAREVAELHDMARLDVHRERECVMCLCEEMSVVFLPCAHQVVCVKCNDLHEKQGMRDCPSCRTPIKQRIRVYGVSV